MFNLLVCIPIHNLCFDHKFSGTWCENGFLQMIQKLSPMTLYCLKCITHHFLCVVVVGIWYIEFKTLLLASYATSLEICKKVNWKPNITHKHYLETIVESYSSSKMVNLSNFFAHKKGHVSQIFGGIEISYWNLWNVQKGETHDTSK